MPYFLNKRTGISGTLMRETNSIRSTMSGCEYDSYEFAITYRPVHLPPSVYLSNDSIWTLNGQYRHLLVFHTRSGRGAVVPDVYVRMICRRCCERFSSRRLW